MSDLIQAIKSLENRISILERYGNNLGVTSTPTAGTFGIAGDMKWDSSYLYIYTGSVWKKVSLSSL